MIQHRPYTDTVDSWACGILCYEFIAGRAPFTGPNNDKTYENITAGEYTCDSSVISQDAQSFISSALRPDPIKRYTCGELFLHKWVQKQGIYLQLNPTN